MAMVMIMIIGMNLIVIAVVFGDTIYDFILTMPKHLHFVVAAAYFFRARWGWVAQVPSWACCHHGLSGSSSDGKFMILLSRHIL